MEGLYRNGPNAKLTKAGSQLAGCSVGIGQGKHTIGGKVTLGNAIGVQGTPAFIIGETMIAGADIEALKAAIEDARRNASKSGPKAG